MSKVKASSAQRNKEAILRVFNEYELSTGRLLEIGSGSGEHGIFFANEFPDLHWITSDVDSNFKDIEANLRRAKHPNLHGPELVHIGIDDLPRGGFDYIFTANTLHDMSWKECKTLFKVLGNRLKIGSVVFIYGPFNYDGEYTSKSNEEFDGWIKERNSKSGIRNFQDVLGAMTKNGLKLIGDHEMPVNNRVLVFKRTEAKE